MITVCKYSLSKNRFEEYYASCVEHYEKTIKRKKSQEARDKGYKELENDYYNAIAHFEELKSFLKRMIDKYGQTYYTGNGSKGITITDDEISLILRTPGLSDSFLDYPRLPDNDDFEKDDYIENLEEVFYCEARLDGSYPANFSVALAITIGDKLNEDPVALMILDIDKTLDDIDVSLSDKELSTLGELMSDEYLTENTRKVEFQSSNTILKYDKPQSQMIENHKQETEIKAEKKRGQKSEKAKTTETQTEKAEPKSTSPAPVKSVAPAPVNAEASAPQVAAAEYIPPVFPPRINDLEIKRFYEYTDPFADVNGKEFAVFIDEFYYASCIDYLNRNGAKVVLCPSENTDWTCQEMCSHKTPKILDRQISGGVMRELL